MPKICKRTRDYLICRVNAGHVTIPIASTDKIPVNVYESPKCTFCPDLRPKLNAINRKLGHILRIQYIDLEKAPAPNDIIHIPTIKIGKKVIIGADFDAETVLEQLRYKEVL